MPIGETFGCGIAGAFVLYCVIYRTSRIQEFAENPKQKWPVLACDIFVFLICGGLVAAFYSEAKTPREAFVAGLAWQGITGGVLSGFELQTAKASVAARKKTRPPVKL